jgi:predicted extracellular nuclease
MKLPKMFLIWIGLMFVSPFVATIQAQSTTVVISEVRTRGPNGVNDEFVELHNRAAVPIDISGWRLRASNSTGSFGDRRVLPASTFIQPGCYYLLTNSSAGGYSGGPAGNATYPVELFDNGGVAITLPNGTPVDSVGWSTGSQYREGTTLTPLTTNVNRGYERQPGGANGHVDTNNNANDFRVLAPSNPQNASSPCLGSVDPAVSGAVTPNPVVQTNAVLVTASLTAGAMPPSTGMRVTVNLAPLGWSSNQTLYDDGTNGDATAGDGTYSYRLESVLAAPGTHTVAFLVTDLQARSGSSSVSVVVEALPVIHMPHAVQGAGTTSPFVGQPVIVEGVVTARRGLGFFMQTAAGSEDSDPQSSEALYVLADEALSANVVAGTLVRVTGTVFEMSRDGSGLTLTTVAGSPHVVSLGTAAVPAATPLTQADLLPSGANDQLERFEAMRVSVEWLTSVSPTSGFFATATGGEAAGVATSTGAFYGVLGNTPRPMREDGLAPSAVAAFANQCATGEPCSIPVFDGNVERLRVESAALGGPRLDVTAGVVVSGMLAVLDSGMETWSLLPLPDQPGMVSANVLPGSAAPAGLGQFTVASLNLQRFFDMADDPSTSDVVLTAENYAARLAKASLVVRAALGMPDVIGVQEVESLGVLRDLADRINADAGKPGDYSAWLVEGQGADGLDVGALVRSRVRVTDVFQFGSGFTFTDPDDGSEDLLFDRPLLVLQTKVSAPAQMLDAQLSVVVNHLGSSAGVDAPGSARVRVQRRAQAEFLAMVLDDLEETSPVVAVGGFNALNGTDGFVDVMGTVTGRPALPDQVVVASADLVDPDYALGTSAYSVVVDGNAAAVDHALLSTQAQALFQGGAHVRMNADFPEVYRHESTRVERLSDHDPLVTYFAFPRDTIAPVIHSFTPSVTALWPPNHKMVPVSFVVNATDNRGSAACRITRVLSTEPTGNELDWTIDGPFAVSLRSEGQGRTYTVTVSCSDQAGNVATANACVVVRQPSSEVVTKKGGR